MRILATADLHYNISRSKQAVRRLADEMLAAGGDVLILAGDIAGAQLTDFEEALYLFADFKGAKLFVPGNHDLWALDGESSLDRWQRLLPQAAAKYGFTMLDRDPVVLEGLAFVGSVGWYDYSFRLRELRVPMRFYRAKVGPGAAMGLSRYRHLLKDGSDLLRRHVGITTIWNDGRNVKLPCSDRVFTRHLLQTLQRHLEQVSGEVETIVAAVHHLPHKELVWYRGDDGWDFAAAFLGSGRFARLFKRYEKVRLCFCGHSHRSGRFADGHTEYVNIGSTYRHKRFCQVDV